MRFRFTAKSLQEGEAALRKFSSAEVKNNSLAVAMAIFKAVIDAHKLHLNNTNKKHKWADFEDVTDPTRPPEIYDDAVDILNEASAEDLASLTNTIVANVVDATMISQSTRVVPGKTRWENYVEYVR